MKEERGGKTSNKLVVIIKVITASLRAEGSAIILFTIILRY